MNINTVTLTGNLTRDPETKSLPSGQSVTSLRIAVGERFKDAAGEWQDRPNFFDVTVWGGQADACAKYLQKGRPVAVQGRLKWREWESDGTKRQAVDVQASVVQFLGDGKTDGKATEKPSDVTPSASDDIPF